MFTRRSMIRALGFVVPAAAVAAAVGLPKPASGGYALSTSDRVTASYAEAITSATGPDSAVLSAFDSNTGGVVAGRIEAGSLTISVKNLHPDAVVEFRDGLLRIARPTA